MGQSPSRAKKDGLVLPDQVADKESERSISDNVVQTHETKKMVTLVDETEEANLSEVETLNLDIGCTPVNVMHGHSHNIKCVLCIPPPNQEICVTCSDDCTIIIWDTVSGQKLKTLTQDAAVTHLILWNNAQIVSSNMRGTVTQYSVLPPYNSRCLRKFSGPCFKLMKIDEEHILATLKQNFSIAIFHGRTGKLEKWYEVPLIDWTSFPKKSKQFKNSFYINQNSRAKDGNEVPNPLSLYSYDFRKKELEIVRKVMFSCLNKVSNYTVYINRKSEELVFAITGKKEMWVFNSTTLGLVKRCLVTRWIYGISCFQRRYILVADGGGKVAIYDGENDFMRVMEKPVFDEGICLDIDYIRNSKFGTFGNNGIRFVIVGTEFKIKIFDVEMSYKTDLNRRDQEERVTFLMDKTGTPLIDPVFRINIRLKNMNLKDLYKILVM